MMVVALKYVGGIFELESYSKSDPNLSYVHKWETDGDEATLLRKNISYVIKSTDRVVAMPLKN